MLSIPPVECTTSRESLNSGGPITQATVSKSDRIVLWSNIQVRNTFIISNRRVEGLDAAYTVDDGKGGVVHVNVSRTARLRWLLTDSNTGQLVRQYLEFALYTLPELYQGRLAKTLVTLVSSKHIALGRLDMMRLIELETSTCFQAWTTPGKYLLWYEVSILAKMSR